MRQRACVFLVTRRQDSPSYLCRDADVCASTEDKIFRSPLPSLLAFFRPPLPSLSLRSSRHHAPVFFFIIFFLLAAQAFMRAVVTIRPLNTSCAPLPYACAFPFCSLRFLATSPHVSPLRALISHLLHCMLTESCSLG